jgi:hypothetical protein
MMATAVSERIIFVMRISFMRASVQRFVDFICRSKFRLDD